MNPLFWLIAFSIITAINLFAWHQTSKLYGSMCKQTDYFIAANQRFLDGMSKFK